jgi:Disulfide bond chaperones of the HSP33 family
MSDDDAGGCGDYVLPFQIETPGIRGRLVRLGPAVESIVGADRYPPPVAVLLAETLVMGAVLASGLKYDGIFTLQLHGDGPVDVVMMDVTSDGDMRGYARFDAERLSGGSPTVSGPVPRLLGAGRMVFTVDQGPNTERYQGVTLLEGATIGECAHAYFRQSEQLQTAIRLAATDASLPGERPRAAALMLQRLPPSPGAAGTLAGAFAQDADDDWRRAVVLLSSLSPQELLASADDDDAMLYRLFHEDGVRVYRHRPLRHRCRCSREKVDVTLRAFPKEEVESMMVDDRVTVTCEFCKTVYVFDQLALDRLYADR